MGDKISLSNRFEYAAKIALYVLAGMLPIWFIPWSAGVEFGREFTFTLLIAVAAIFWLVSILTAGEIRFQYSPLIYGGAAVLLIFALGTIFSKAPFFSAFLADPVAERLSTLFLGILLMVITGSIFKSRDIGKALFILVFSGALAAFLHVIQFFFNFPLYRFIASYAGSVDFNVVGTVNGLALLYSTLFLMSLGVFFSSSFRQAGISARFVLMAVFICFFLNLLFINFRTAWIVIFGSGIFLLGLILKDIPKNRQRKEDASVRRDLDWRYLVAIGLIVFSMVMILVKSSVLPWLNLPSEVSPSFKGTLAVAQSVFSEGPKAILFGSGPGTFGLDWSLYRDPSINQTQFWNIRFNQGFSFFTTLAATSGIFGVLAFLLFLGSAAFLFLKKILVMDDEERPVATSLFLGFVGLVFTVFLYPATLTSLLLLFLVIGLLSVAFAERPRETEREVVEEIGSSQEAGYEIAEEGDISAFAWRRRLSPRRWKRYLGRSGFWQIEERSVRFENQWAVFLSSLAAVFFISLGVAALYLEVGRARAILIAQGAVEKFKQGNIEDAVRSLERAAAIDPNNFRTHQSLTQMRIEKVRRLIERASRGENVQQDFQSTVAAAIQSSQRGIQLHPIESLLWGTQGALYETIIPFVQGSERFAIDSYRKATEYDPLNPSIWVDLGRAALTFADRIQLALVQNPSAANRVELEQARIAALQEAARAFQRASEVKQDFAPAHFLLAQAAIRAGDLRTALQSTENTKTVAPFDIGVAFQLGLLYYQAGNLDRAKEEFERAVSLNENYSNARYFLGLIYDRRGEEQKAMAEFERIEKLNPDNQEVKRILVNLRRGKDALDGIVPPAEPPEKRKEAPVKEQQGRGIK